MGDRFESVQQVREGLKAVNYLADEGIAGVAFLADRLGKPVLVEGPAGTGKTQLAKSIAEATGSRLIRLQCYEGLDESKALYEWNYKKQLLRIQASGPESTWDETHDDIFSEGGPEACRHHPTTRRSRRTRLRHRLRRPCRDAHGPRRHGSRGMSAAMSGARSRVFPAFQN